ncbi:MAG: dUTP diphosphatase [Chitinophagales bacterium]
MPILPVKIINKSSNPLPAYATDDAAGMDLKADIPQPVTFRPMERHLIPTGIFIELPSGYEAQVRPRSGLALKQGITCLNSPGTVDADYRGELKVILINLSDSEQSIHPGDRIAQMVISTVEKVIWEPVEKINQTNRNDGGFGHTGKR